MQAVLAVVPGEARSFRVASRGTGVTMPSPCSPCIRVPSGLRFETQFRLGWNPELLNTSYRYTELKSGVAGLELDYTRGEHDQALNARISFSYRF